MLDPRNSVSRGYDKSERRSKSKRKMLGLMCHERRSRLGRHPGRAPRDEQCGMGWISRLGVPGKSLALGGRGWGCETK